MRLDDALGVPRFEGGVSNGAERADVEGNERVPKNVVGESVTLPHLLQVPIGVRRENLRVGRFEPCAKCGANNDLTFLAGLRDFRRDRDNPHFQIDEAVSLGCLASL